ncbi:hypothetical protein [Polaribacter sp. SA4-12]|uniref:hypothetical protein n=1 Tax=Polaribacter sp. SA4-12 TaxID=1312072 RepID=UPI000B3CB810|nr:hypothetical protein [Polaribacter sp. SA4-12]ARV15922.1 hypothetical protein BTO07_12550 [Polaribacter sp. SA4-12]
MKNNYEITEKQLTFLEDYLKRKKRILDPEDLYELIDHLVTDFETTTENGNLSQYLSDNSDFIFNYKGNNRSDIHWSYQRQLWSNFFGFFTTLKFIPITISVLSIIFFLFYELDFSNKNLSLLFVLLIGIPAIYGFINTYHKKKQIRRLVSFKYLGNILALPQMFLYLFSPIKDFLFEHKFLFFLYVTFAFGLNMAGVLLVKQKRILILKKYKHLLN